MMTIPRGRFVSISEQDGDDIYPPAFINGNLVPDLREHNSDVAKAVVHHLQWIADEQQKLADRVRERLAESDLEAAVAQASEEIANRPREEPKKPREPTPEIKVLEVLPGDRAIVSTKGFVRLYHGISDRTPQEMTPRCEAEHVVEYFADWSERHRSWIEEYSQVESMG